MRYLVTGGAGFIGSHLVDALLERGGQVIVLDDLSTGSEDNVVHHSGTTRFRFVEGSSLDEGLVSELVSEADAVFHLAATVGVELVVMDPLRALHNNIRATEVVLDAASRSRTRVLVTSTSEVYGKSADTHLSEDADRVLGPPTVTRWAYAASKEVDEILAYGYWRQRGTPTVVSRLFNCSGPRQTGAYGMVVPRFVRQALAGDELTVFGDGTQTRCFCHVADTVAALIGLIDEPDAFGKVFNVGGREQVTIRELAERVIAMAGSTSRIRHVSYEEAYEEGFEDMHRAPPDTSRLHRLTGWATRHSLDDILRDVVAHERARAAALR